MVIRVFDKRFKLFHLRKLKEQLSLPIYKIFKKQLLATKCNLYLLLCNLYITFASLIKIIYR